MNELDVFFRSWQEVVLTCLALGVSQLVYVLFGFGAGLIAVGTLAVFLPNLHDVVVIILLVSFPAELYVVASSWKKIKWRGVALILAGVAVGIPLGAWLLQLGDPTIVLAVLGLVLVVVGTGFLVVRQRQSVSFPRWVGAPLGLVSGVLAGLFGTGGPPLIFYYQLSGVEKAAFRAHLMAIFLSVTVVRFPTYAVSGLITETRIWSALMVMPAVLLGAYIGHRLHVNINDATFRRLVSAALVVIGLVLLLRSFSGAW